MKNTAERMDPRQESGETTAFLNQSPEASLEQSFARLSQLSRKLRHCGTLNALSATITLMGLLVSILVEPSDDLDSVRLSIRALGIGAAIHGLYRLFIWNRLRQEGMALYEELSDEVEWRHLDGARLAERGSQGAQRPNLTIRITLRDFLRATALPLVPGPFSVLIYFIFYVLFFVANLLVR